jgi:hypothetical protein
MEKGSWSYMTNSSGFLLGSIGKFTISSNGLRIIFDNI